MARRENWRGIGGLVVFGVSVGTVAATLIVLSVVLLPLAAHAISRGAIDWSLAASYVWVALIGAGVGGTELMSRYLDQPFDAVRSAPGGIYMLVNLAAAVLALFLMTYWHQLEGDPVKQVLTAGVASMAIFRSGLFTTRIGMQEISFGPNLILKILLDALDRAYDRRRAFRRSELIGAVMGGIDFTNARRNLPELCFSLMQNVSDAERKRFDDIVKQLQDAADLDDEVRSLALGLGLIGIVGEDLLRVATVNLGNSITSFKALSDALLTSMAKIKEQVILDNLLPLCNGLAHSRDRLDPYDMTRFKSQVTSLDSLNERAQAYLLVFNARRQFGEAVVANALLLLPDAIVTPPPPLVGSAATP